MRGVVSLAAALSVPVYIQGSQPFPYRNLILFITFIVILVTLVFQGLTLPWLIRKVKPKDKSTTIPEHRQEIIIQKEIAKASLEFLDAKYGRELAHNEHLNNLRARLQIDLTLFNQELEGIGEAKDNQPRLLFPVQVCNPNNDACHYCHPGRLRADAELQSGVKA
jgi:CPA1 family monovalent cation:H+ antiporter